ncbi:hypothetical protein ACFVYT_24885 [Streptomyces sp. NPDC058290]|uniref:hypothetical protein n=1 Tax=Streptomyces sp. NPDC058290 TaxID=3346426 RepID=UPI0036E57FA4
MSKDYSGKRGARELERDAREGMIVYYTSNHATNLAGQFEDRTWSALICTHYSRFWHAWMFGAYSVHERRALVKKGSIKAGDVVLYLGGDYCSTTPPRGIRELASPEPDCREEGWNGMRPGQIFGGRLNRAEIEAMEAMAQDATDRRDKRAAERGNRKGWF